MIFLNPPALFGRLKMRKLFQGRGSRAVSRMSRPFPNRSATLHCGSSTK